MTEQRLKVESGPPEHVVADSDVTPADDASGGAKEKARDVAGQAKEHAQAAAEQAKDKAAAQVDERTTQVGRQISGQAESLDGVAEELRRQGKDQPAKVVEQVSQRVKDVGDYLERTEGESLVQAASDAARENPAAAAAVSAAAGFAAGRAIKAAKGDDAGDEAQPEPPAGGGG